MLAKRRRLAVIGHPVAHSRSPAMHNAAFAELGLADEWIYEAIDIPPSQFAERAPALPERGFVGANITIPHKHAALAIADEASAAASEIGAANTLTFVHGGIHADNTDAPGFLASLPAPPRGRRALVLGAGGAARAVVWALVGEGAEVAVWNRTPERAERLCAELGGSALRADGLLPSLEFDIVVNTTSVGMERPDDDQEMAGEHALRRELEDLRLGPGGFREGQVVVDLAYGAAKTALMSAATRPGATAIDGIEVLVRQGATAFRIWTGVDPPLAVMRAAARG